MYIYNDIIFNLTIWSLKGVFYCLWKSGTIPIFVVVPIISENRCRYFLIIHLSIGDLILAVTRSINAYFSFNTEAIYYIYLHSMCYNLSLFTTVYIAIDRYIAIRFCLEYHLIVTKRRLMYLITFSWIFVNNNNTSTKI